MSRNKSSNRNEESGAERFGKQAAKLGIAAAAGGAAGGPVWAGASALATAGENIVEQVDEYLEASAAEDEADEAEARAEEMERRVEDKRIEIGLYAKDRLKKK